MLYLYPQLAIPVTPNESYMAPQFAIWYGSGGKQGVEPKDPQMKRALELFRSASGQDASAREATAKEIWKVLVDQQYSIGTVGQSPAFMGVRLVSNRLGNIPARVCIAQHCRTPGGSHPETWYFKD
jgi:peptide/nickel transport system substrate-binding protein